MSGMSGMTVMSGMTASYDIRFRQLILTFSGLGCDHTLSPMFLALTLTLTLTLIGWAVITHFPRCSWKVSQYHSHQHAGRWSPLILHFLRYLNRKRGEAA